MTTYTKRELGEALRRVQENPVPPVIRRYDRLHKLFMKELDMDQAEVTVLAYEAKDKLLPNQKMVLGKGRLV